MVSIVIPTYNRKLELSELLEALSRQTFQEFEVIVVNDCGEDVSCVVQLYAELEIHLINLPNNVKNVQAMNVGISMARYPYIMFCDDDDLLLPTHLELMVSAIQEADLVYSDAEIVLAEARDGYRLPYERHLFAYHLDLAGMRRYSTYIPSGSLVRKEALEQAGGLDAEMYHYWDWDLFLRMAHSHRIKRLPVASVLYFFGEEGHLSHDVAEKNKSLDKLCQKHQLGPLPEKNFFSLLDEPELRKRRAPSRILWDGQPFVSRLAAKMNTKNPPKAGRNAIFHS